MSQRSRQALLQRCTALGAHQVEYSLQRSSRRRTIGMRIDDDGLRVSAPLWTSEGEIEAVLHNHARWILDKLRDSQRRPPRVPVPAFVDGDPLLWLGREIPLRRVSSALAVPRACDEDGMLDALPIAHDCDDALAAVCAWYMAQAVPWFRRRAHDLALRLGRAPREIRISSARGRWGSCTGKGVIRLNWRLMQASPQEIDYVVAHELAHLVEMNHSPAFWDTVARILPDWSAASDRLDANDRLYRRI